MVLFIIKEYAGKCRLLQTLKSENLVADLMMSEGYQRAGYEYLMLDDCWSSTTRTKDGR